MAGPVLIIEDEPDIAEMLRYSLQREGFETRDVIRKSCGYGLDGQIPQTPAGLSYRV